MNNIYMEYLTEDAREELILEKEMDLINTDIDYLFTTYEAVNEEKKKNVLIRLIEKIRQLIKRIRENVIPKLLNKIKKKKEIKTTDNDSNESDKIKALPSPDPKNYNEKLYIKNGLEIKIKESDTLVNKLWKYEEKILKIVYNNKYDEKIWINDIYSIRSEYNDISSSISINQPEVSCQNKNIISNLNKTIENIDHISKQAESGLDKIKTYISKLSVWDDEFDNCNAILEVIKNIINICSSMTQLYNKFLDNIRIEYVAK